MSDLPPKKKNKPRKPNNTRKDDNFSIAIDTSPPPQTNQQNKKHVHINDNKTEITLASDRYYRISPFELRKEMCTRARENDKGWGGGGGGVVCVWRGGGVLKRCVSEVIHILLMHMGVDFLTCPAAIKFYLYRFFGLKTEYWRSKSSPH